jgi:hypothetical protein
MSAVGPTSSEPPPDTTGTFELRFFLLALHRLLNGQRNIAGPDRPALERERRSQLALAVTRRGSLFRGQFADCGSRRGWFRVIKHEDRLRRAKYLGALADRLFRNECARLGLDANEAIKSPLLSIITRHALLRLQAVSSKTSRPSQRSDRIAISS